MKKITLLICSLYLLSVASKAQNPLPEFLAENMGRDKVRISWVNGFGDSCVQLMVQTSFDSLRNFKTVFSTESPQLPQNGFLYSLPFTYNFYYRIFYVLSNNTYYFSPSRRATAPVFVPGSETLPDLEPYPANNNGTGNTKPPAPRIITIRSKDSVLQQLEYNDYKKFKDSITRRTKDTLFVLGRDEVLLKPFNPENIWIPSVYIVTNKDGYVQVKLPDAAVKKYRLIFYETDGRKLFTINHVPEPELIIDKTNFLHAGWFKFELYENDKLKEKNKILLQRDF